MKPSLLAASAVLLVALAAPAAAHHSAAMFDRDKQLRLEGTVRTFKWTNPHAWIELTVPKGQESVLWSVEMTSPNNLIESGWKRTTLKAGDKVLLVVNPLRDGRPGGLFVGVRTANGKTFGQVR
jgi:hypothetical protein